MQNEASSVKLGMQFSTLDNPADAEKIFIQLNAQACKHPSMSAFAAKLAKAFGVLRNTEKKIKYEALAQQLSKQHA